ncbi:MAG: PAS domain S-box protein [Acidobacteria bacterium]|nr:PAS domain S-box protein [Acidobacteriota bacterium]
MIALSVANLAGWVIGSEILTSWIDLSVEAMLLITILSTIILVMVLNLHTRDERERALRRERDREAEKRQVMWNLSRDMMVIANPERNLVDVNPAWTTTLGWSREELLGRRYEELLHPDDRARTEEEIGRISDSQSTVLFTNRYRSRDGSYRSLQWHSVREEKGEIFGVARDVTEIVRASETLHNLNRELESRVRLRTRDLETANRELESFSYAVSHDLRAPLRAIEGFSRMVIERHSEDLPEQARHYLERVRTASSRMGEIIDGLLSLSKFSRGDLRTETVNLSEIASDIVEDLRVADPDRNAKVTIERKMHTTGDRRLLQSLLLNLISNAWKFSSERDPAVIEIGSSVNGRITEFHVRDNGAGFDQKHVEKLFKPFQRLHSIEEFDGTGLGLATVQRIVSRHGGAVWAEGELEKGATFRFTLPYAETPEHSIEGAQSAGSQSSTGREPDNINYSESTGQGVSTDA